MKQLNDEVINNRKNIKTDHIEKHTDAYNAIIDLFKKREEEEWKEKKEKSGSSPNVTGSAGGMKVVFNVFTEKDEEIYRRLIFSR